LLRFRQVKLYKRDQIAR